MAKTYFWKDDAVHVVDQLLYSDTVPEECVDLYCLDTNRTSKDKRYGMFVRNAYSNVEWKHIPFKNFPKEFRTWALLLM